MRSEDPESARPDFSVRGRAIQLLRSSGHKTDGTPVRAPEEKDKHVDSSDTSGDRPDSIEKPPVRRRSSDSSLRLPQQMNAEQHIRFLENQRNPKDDTTLHIPSPREFDQGGRVRSVDRDDELQRQRTNLDRSESSPEIMNAPPRVGTHITFNAPEVPRDPNSTQPFPRIETGRASTMDPTTYDLGRGRSRTRRGSGFLMTNSVKTLDVAPYLSYQPTVARNSFFVNLTEEQREELGGIEYRALKTLAVILVCYFVGFQLLGVVCLTPWIYHVSYGSVVTGDGQGRAWWGLFTSASAFNDLGFTLTPDSMISFQSATFPMLLLTYLVIIGNTGFPCMLRFVIWAVSKCVPVESGIWEELQFLLDHPRRCFTLLFPKAATWWLFGILVILNGLDLLFFIILDIHDETVVVLSGWVKFLVGLFQAASTRTAGFAAVNIANLHPGIQVSYLIMMYISVFPIAISMRRTNVYEEKSLGIYAGSNDDDDDSKEPSYVGAHLRKQLSFDLWYIFLGLFIICIVEGSRLENTNEYAFTIFSCLFEIVSAYGTVGLSLGYPTTDASFSSQFQVISKLVIIAMQIRGRHRGLPYELDRAILLPSESLHRKEAQEADRMIQRRNSQMSQYDTRQTASRMAATTSYRSDAGRDDTDEAQTRQRRGTNKSSNSTGSGNDHNRRGIHTAIGSAMYKIAETEDSMKESVQKVTSRTD